jgi:hypothetical protein
MIFNLETMNYWNSCITHLRRQYEDSIFQRNNSCTFIMCYIDYIYFMSFDSADAGCASKLHGRQRRYGRLQSRTNRTFGRLHVIWLSGNRW